MWCDEREDSGPYEMKIRPVLTPLQLYSLLGVRE